MKNDCGIYIVTYGRAENQKTYDFLKNRTRLPIHFVCDDTDSQLGQYQQRYGEKVVVFSKQQWCEKTRTMDNMGVQKTPVYARNFALYDARQRGYEYMLMLDDDISQISYRYQLDGKIKSKKVADFDGIAAAMARYMQTDDRIAILAFSNSGGMIGGLQKLHQGLGRTVNQGMMIRTAM